MSEQQTKQVKLRVGLLPVKIRGTGVVRRADGSIKYDQGAKPGEFNEHLLKEEKQP